MAAEAGGEIRAGIGTRLRAARERKGLTILQAAEKMHVDSRIPESLEAEDFAALGAPVYARGHLRHYAELVGESPAELQELYANATKLTPSQPDLTRIARAQPQSDSGKLVGPAVIGLIAIAAIGTVWWVLSLSGNKAQPTAVHSTTEGSTAGKPAAATADAVGTDAENDTPVALPAPEEPEPSASRVQKNGVGPGTKGGTPTPGGKPIAGAKGAPQASLALTAAAAASATAPPPAPKGKDGELTLKFSSDSWAEVYDAAGQRLFYDVGAASSAHTVRGPAPLRVVLGNPSGVAVEYNGRPALIPAAIQADGSTRFVINAHGRTVPASTASDGD